jgi:hypothetical protein
VTRSTLSLALALALLATGTAHAQAVSDALIEDVRALELGEGKYLLGGTLTPDELAEASKNPSEAYPGTVQLPRDPFDVVADAGSGLILAVFQRQEKARADDVTRMISRLMLQFGEPTTSAHEKLVYWAWSSAGRIEDEAFQQAKKTGEIEVLATVKFSSTIALAPGMSNENTAETGTIYYIITSERLLEAYVGDR